MNDLEIVKRIEKIFNVKLKQLKAIDWISRGYTINQRRQVIGFKLVEFKIDDKKFIQLISILKELSSLSELYLFDNQISDISSLKDLKSLTELNLSGNQISDISSLKDLKSLIELNLSGNQISDISSLKDLKSLSALELSHNQISDISSLKELKRIKTLGLSYNQISDISSLKDLKSLSALELSHNQISDISSLKDLKSLSDLQCWHNKINDIFSLKELKSLAKLDLSFNQISDITLLNELKSLKRLALLGNQISDISSLKDLKTLSSLYLADNQISDISSLKDLKTLSSLYLADNQISDISSLKDLKSLTELNLSGNQISDISSLKDLKSLTELNLSGNQISDISSLKDLNRLTRLVLKYNPIEQLSEWITWFNMNILWKDEYYNQGFIAFYDNPLKSPPVEIVKQGKEAIRNYFEQLKKEKKEKKKPKFLFEAKILIIGEGGVGKTSFANKLQDVNSELPEEKDTTLGIKVSKWDYPITYKFVKNEINTIMYVNLWDFGGQKLYRGTHQIFFCEKSLYILIGENREEKTDYSFWLNTVDQLGGNESSLLIIINEKFERAKYEFDEPGYKSHFGKIIKEVLALNLKSDIQGILKMQECVKYWLKRLPLIGSPLPAAYVDIRDELYNEKVNYISFDRFREICKKYDITDAGMIRTLSGYYSIIGAFTHYIDDPVLQDRIYLNSNWLLNTVYKILDNSEIVKKKGNISRSEIEKIWQVECLDFEFHKLTQLMHNFGLMYQIKGTDKYVVPEHLPTTMPYTEWEYEKSSDILQFIFEFDKFKPSGIMSNLIVTLNTYIKDHNKVWHRGVNIENDGAFAEIIESYGSDNFHIRIAGENKKKLLGIITDRFEEILRPFGNLKYERMVPCICNGCRKLKKPYFFKYSDLINRKQAGKKTIECGFKPFDDVNVEELIDEVFIRKNNINKTKKVFISYSKVNTEELRELEKFLKPLVRDNQIEPFNDRLLIAGEQWEERILKELNVADAIIFLVTQDFIATDFINDVEIKKALEREKPGSLKIIPVILDTCDWENTPLAKFTVLPPKGKPIKKHSNENDAWMEALNGIKNSLAIN